MYEEPSEKYFRDHGLKLNMISRVRPEHYVEKTKASLQYWEQAAILAIIMERKLFAIARDLVMYWETKAAGPILGKKFFNIFYTKFLMLNCIINFKKNIDVSVADILDSVYKKPLPNRYIASFAIFLTENRGHYMIENIIEDGLFDFFSIHLAHYPESGKIPIFFTGSVAFGFQDILKELCKSFGWEIGKFLKKPMEGLIAYHKNK